MFHVVDDIPELRDVLKDLITSVGHQSMQFDSTESYLEYFHSDAFTAPVAILTDYMMTGKTGLQLIKQVRKALPHQKAVIISGTPCSEFSADIESYLCYSLTKPYKITKLFALLEALNTCDKNCLADSDQYQPHCQYGIKHECPFYPRPVPK